MHGLTIAVAALTVSAGADAKGPYLTLRDDGTLAGKITGPATALEKVVEAYEATGSPKPDVISVWTAFSQNKNDVETLYLPASNDVTGIGLENAYGGDGTFDDYAPLRAVLLHNNVLALKKRADLVGAPLEGYGEYLFLLELSHVWGPSVKPEALQGFPFHWSFWMDAGGSPAGGNTWKDNGDGTFSVVPRAPKDITYSMLDLYLMGLADPSEVPPFGLLEDAVPPPDVKDPFTGKELSAASFPHFAAAPVTVQATRKTITVEDIVAANGPRRPARKDAPQTLKLGIVLMVPASADDAAVAKAEAAMDPLASALAPAFERATRGRGHLEVVTKGEVAPAEPDPTEGDPAAEPTPPATTTTTEGGCATARSARATAADAVGAGGFLAMVLAVVSRRRGGARSSRSSASDRS